MSSLHRPGVLAAALLLALQSACAPAAAPAPDLVAERSAVDSVLNALHQSAAEGDFARYFTLYAPDAVFLGTDATERWDLAAFRGYATGSAGWIYQMTERHTYVDADGNTAWFDERLRHANYGEVRGTGVLVKGDSGWKIAQYNLSFPVPNALADEFTQRIVAAEAAP